MPLGLYSGVLEKDADVNTRLVQLYELQKLVFQEYKEKNARGWLEDPRLAAPLYLIAYSALDDNKGEEKGERCPLVINAERYGSKARFMNYSCDPNCRLEIWKVRDGGPVVVVVTDSEIKSGEGTSLGLWVVVGP
eukprot:UN02927